ncbi:chain length determinant protein EpsF [Massilia sp. DWR3-1-1]|uniref:chain length determinant protein EpsF n=1 Tax=Massilia sp. DWR3-1-1 TaxID=2804559 RepID=UPI003CEDF63F
MTFQQILSILRARRYTVLLAMAVIIAASVAISLLLPKNYEASTSLVVNFKATDPVSGTLVPSTMMTGFLATQADIVQSKAVALAVVDTLHLADLADTRAQFHEATEGVGDIRDWLAGLLLKKLAVVPARESNVITVSFTGANPEFAATVVNAFAAEYQKASVRLKVQPLKQASAYFTEQIKDLRDKLEQAQARLSKYQQEKGLVSVDTRLDVESARLNELSSQLVVVQAQVADATSRHSTRLGAATESPDVVSNALVQNLKASLSQAEANLAQLEQRLDVNHPQYQAAKAEVDKRRAELGAQVGIAYGSLGNNSRIARQRQADLSAALAAQKARILELNRARDEMSVLAHDVDGAQRTYDAAIARFSQTSIEGGANQPDVAVLSPALPPMKPSSPKLLLNIVISIVFGAGFGLGLALLLEMMDRRAHCAEDVAALQIAVLGEWHHPRPARRGLARLGARIFRRPTQPA